MHSLQKQFHDEIITKQLFQKEDKVLLAVSGGVDSMVLAHLFLSSNFSFAIAHCNFGLRGKASDEDEKLVKDWAKSNAIECHVKRFKIEGSIQLAARNARYHWFVELLKENDYQYLATAHHLNDSLETALINLSRGTGIKGISGITNASGKVIRPLLFATKDELVEYAKDQKVNWREDASNAKSDYDRNLIRNEVVPLLKKMNPSLETTFKNTAERLALTNRLLANHVDNVKNDHLKEVDGHLKLAIDWIKTDMDGLILSEIVAEYGFNYVTSKEIFSALDKPGKKFLSEEYKLTIDRRSIYISKKHNESNEETVIDGEGTFNIAEQVLKVSFVGYSEVKFDSGNHVAHFNPETIQFPISIRKWRMGDRFKPLGMKGSKKVSDYLIDRKIPVALKDQVQVITSGDEIVWLVSHQISEDFKVDMENKSVLKLEILQ